MPYTLYAYKYFILHLVILVPLRILDHGHAEPEPEELTELAPAEETNPELTEGKHRCINTTILDFT